MRLVKCHAKGTMTGKRSLYDSYVLIQKRPDQPPLPQDRMEPHGSDDQQRSNRQGGLLHRARPTRRGEQ